ncbi:hypothetical protein TRVA0_077S00166 [Trichomonascus vanleenenianus]|uniref:uncharacterized protein n=1 Tax=Trichomonascus vanleenenianus TaxID=2268995 RepID=UPI003ECB223F
MGIPGHLVTKFQTRTTPEEQGSGWSELWNEGKDTLWDRGKPSPALVDVIESNKDLFNPFTYVGRRKKALVPGCGRGYDVVMLALHGYDAYGMDVAETAIEEAKKYAAKELPQPQDYNYADQSLRESADRGTVGWFQGNFFAEITDIKFDLIYDYTFLCALHPTLRVKWLASMTNFLADDGLLVCLEFPMYKDLSAEGPPWGLNGVHWDLLASGRDGILHTRKEADESENGRFKRIVYFKPERTHEMGQGTDMLSVWTKK